VSSPAPPSTLSTTLNVSLAAVASELTANAWSLPAPRVSLSRAVVSDQISDYGILRIINSLLSDTIGISVAAYRLPTWRRGLMGAYGERI